MLKSIFVVTVVVLNLGEVEDAWQDRLDYRTVDKGQLSAELAESWNAPAVAGQGYVVMQPESGAESYLRFIESDDRGNYEPMKTQGWNSVEILAKDPEALHASLQGTQFDILAAPKFLTDKKNVLAFQTLGPADELLYFTRIFDPAQSNFNLGSAQSRVDRVFIMVLGTSDMDATRAFYSDILGQTVLGPWPYRIGVLSRAWGQPADTLHPLSMIQLDGPFALELDQYPVQAERRTAAEGGLAYGPVMVSFRVESLDDFKAASQGPSRILQAIPYSGSEVVFLEGPSGELIELVAPLGENPDG
jgi:catechol 2,3-dioxygenase-like lactoylglutathione lyase family enzyme